MKRILLLLCTLVLLIVTGCGDDENYELNMDEQNSNANSDIQQSTSENVNDDYSISTAPHSLKSGQWDPAPTNEKPLTGKARGMQQKHMAMINREALSAGLDPRFVHAIISRESRYDTNAISTICYKSPQSNRTLKYQNKNGFCYKDSGTAHGLMQLMPATSAQMGLTPSMRISHPHLNVKAGIRYLNDMSWANGNIQAMAAGYNSGPARAKALLTGNTNSKYWRDDGTSNGVPGPGFWGGETFNYAKHVAGYYELYSANPELIGLTNTQNSSEVCYERELC